MTATVLVAVVALVVLAVRERDHQKTIEKMLAAVATERQILLERIQRPERPVLATEPVEIPDPEPDHAHLVGTIVYREPDANNEP